MLITKRALLLTLSLPVILFSCQKKANSDKVTTNIITNNSISNLVAPVTPVIASEPPESVNGDLTVTYTDKLRRQQIIMIATQSEYNSLDYKHRILVTGFKNAVQYLVTTTSDSTALKFNADNTYSILLNPTIPASGAQQSCKVCNKSSLLNCIINMGTYMYLNGQLTVNATITIGYTAQGDPCLIIVYSFSKKVLPVITTPAEGTLAMTFVPAITFGNIYYEKYILRVRGWVLGKTADPIDGGAITDPNTWSRQRLVQYLGLFNSDASHTVVNNQNNDVFQGQLEYYIYDIY